MKLSSKIKPVYFHAKSAEEEAEYLVKKIRELTENGTYEACDIAILYRAHYISRTIEEVFQREKIAYTLNSGVPFFDRAEILRSRAYRYRCHF